MFKNLTIRQITVYISTIVVLTNMLLFVLYLVLGQDIDMAEVSIVKLCIFSFCSFFLVFFIIKYLIERFILRKIKVIYKIITDSKSNVADSKPQIIPKDTSFEDINFEVTDWADKTSKEITSLKTLEVYRKQYVGDISHELKTPIFAIQGYIHTLLEGGLYDEKINKEYLKRASRNITRLETIVDDLEMINKLENEKVILANASFQIKNLIDEVMQDFSSGKIERNITLDYKKDANQSFEVLGDYDSITQVVINLITNAIRYGKENGHVLIGLYDIGDNVLVEVSDNGIGIEEKHLKHLFDRFYRVDLSRSRMKGGSGLGLSIVKHIIEAHNGTIKVRSTVGVGSTFGFTLPKST